MNKFTIISNRYKDPNRYVARKIYKYLTQHKRECLILEAEDNRENQTYYHTDASRIPDDTECIIVLGGDGTLLQAARDVVDKDIPLFGINLGTLGYLAEIDQSSIYPALDRLMADNFLVEKRMMLSGSVVRDGEEIAKNIALNDIVISRVGPLRVVKFNNYINGTYLNTYRADGIIISTPTGSTGYSLSAGGPIISPEASLFLMTPLAPHTLNTRSVIFPDGDVITVELGENRDGGKEKGSVHFDGAAKVPLITGDKVIVRKSRRDTKIIKLNDISFLEILRNKMAGN